VLNLKEASDKICYYCLKYYVTLRDTKASTWPRNKVPSGVRRSTVLWWTLSSCGAIYYSGRIYSRQEEVLASRYRIDHLHLTLNDRSMLNGGANVVNVSIT
jgi:uncharacterized protein with PIN domain